MQTFSKKTLVATATIALFGLGAASTAQAVNTDTSAFSLLTISNFIWTNTAGVPRPVVPGDFGPGSVINNQASNSAILTPGGFATNNVGPVPGGIAPFQSCVGTGCPAANVWAKQSGAYLARGANDLAGAIIGGPPGATAHGLADTELDSATGSGNGNAQVGTSSNFNFTVAGAGTFAFDFDAALDLIAQVHSGANFGTATATSNYAVKITQIVGGVTTTVFDWLPGTSITGGIETISQVGNSANPCPNQVGNPPFNLNNSVTANFPGDSGAVNFTCHYNASGIALVAGVAYKLTIDHKNASTANQNIPEPATLALMGLGLLGVAGVTRRRTKA